MIRYWPPPSVTAVRTFSIRAGLDASTVTPGSTAPEASLTTPVIDACAHASAGRPKAITNRKRTRCTARILPPRPRNRLVSLFDADSTRLSGRSGPRGIDGRRAGAYTHRTYIGCFIASRALIPAGLFVPSADPHAKGSFLMRRLRGTVPLIVACVLLFPGLAQAQASLAGVVRDNTGAVLPGVTVEATSPVLIEKSRTAVTDGSGQYRITDLPPGTYSLSFTLSGFNITKRDDV